MIELNSRWRIICDDFCFVVEHKTTKLDKDGEPIWEQIGYYPDIQQAVRGLRNKVIFYKLKSSKNTLEKAVKEVDSITKDFTDFINGKISELPLYEEPEISVKKVKKK